MTSRYGRKLALGCSVLLLSAGLASAGEMTLSWPKSTDEVTAGYLVEVLDASGSVANLVDAKTETRIRVAQLVDGTTYRFRVRAYDTWGNRAATPSTELVSMPAPHIDAVENWTVSGRTTTCDLVGTNFASGARAFTTAGGLRVLGTVSSSTSRATVTLDNPSGKPALLPADFYVVNPVRLSEEYLMAHPELLDVNRDGKIDQADLAALAASFGKTVVTNGVSRDLDPNGDGVVDGDDSAAVRSYLGLSTGTRSGAVGHHARTTRD